jgi:transcriptional regulator with XRE-family HTH domain
MSRWSHHPHMRGRNTETEQHTKGEVGRRVQAVRQELGWTQAGLAHALDIEASTLSRYETGMRAYPLPLLVRTAEVLGVPTQHLLQDSTAGEPEADLRADLERAWARLSTADQRVVVQVALALARGH